MYGPGAVDRIPEELLSYGTSRKTHLRRFPWVIHRDRGTNMQNKKDWGDDNIVLQLCPPVTFSF